MLVEEFVELVAPALWGLALLTAFYTLLPRAVLRVNRSGSDADRSVGIDLAAQGSRATIGDGRGSCSESFGPVQVAVDDERSAEFSALRTCRCST